jgi:SAM-dependent methyltransferase
MKETTKAYRRRIKDESWGQIFRGRGLDIGSGDDPFLTKWWGDVTRVDTFDQEDGDAQFILRNLHDRAAQYDFVHSSNCLEHMVNPQKALVQWLMLVKPGGHLVFTVPDEDLYEQGVWPSQWNGDHKWTFTIWKGKKKSWSRRSINLAEMVGNIVNGTVVKLGIVDTNYDYSLQRTGVDQTLPEDGAEAFIEVVIRRNPIERVENATFKHSGARGDLIYGLPTLAALGGGSLQIHLTNKHYVGHQVGKKEVQQFKDLLERQSYIKEVSIWSGKEVDFDLDRFRDLPIDHTLLALSHLIRFGVEWDITKPWIDPETVTPNHEADIIVARSPRYHGPMAWQLLHPYAEKCLFLGYPAEHKEFVSLTGLPMPQLEPKSIVGMAEVIRGSKLFIGNQSFPYALAEAMKHPRVLEECPQCPNCTPTGPDGYVGLTEEVLERYIEGKEVVVVDSGRAHSPWMSRKATPQPRVNPRRWRPVQNRPLVSAILPAQNVPQDEVQAAVDYLGIPDEVGEIIVVSSNPADHAKNIKANVPWAHAVNLGAEQAHGDFLCIVRPEFSGWNNWCYDLLGMFPDERAGLAGTVQVLDGFPHVSGPAMMLSRAAYEMVGVYDWRLNLEGPWLELALCLRLMANRFTFRHVGGRVRHWAPEEKDDGGTNAAFVKAQYGVEI